MEFKFNQIGFQYVLIIKNKTKLNNLHIFSFVLGSICGIKKKIQFRF